MLRTDDREKAFPARLEIPDDVLQIARTLEEAGFEAWCVGGALRDRLMEEPTADFDLATAATPDWVQKLFRHTVGVGERFGTIAVRTGRTYHEVTTFRRDVVTDGRHAVVEYGASLEEDLARRDFTFNAIAYHPLRHEWRDPFHGREDLDQKTVRAVGEPGARFREDYLRILRALRFAARFDFRIESATWEAGREAAPGLAGLSAERVREEWFKGLRTARSLDRLVNLWWNIGAAAVWLPELIRGSEPGTVELARLHPEDRDPILLTTLLTLDPLAVLVRLKASNADMARAAAVLAGPAEPDGVTAQTVRRWLAAVGDAADDLANLWAARHGARPPWEHVVRGIRDRGEPLSRRALAVTGADLQSAGIPPGPEMGAILDRLVELVVDDPSRNTREELLARARALR